MPNEMRRSSQVFCLPLSKGWCHGNFIQVPAVELFVQHGAERARFPFRLLMASLLLGIRRLWPRRCYVDSQLKSSGYTLAY